MISRISYWFQSLMNNPLETLLSLAFLAMALLISLILHECAHGWVALKCGDPTAKLAGRLNLDPRRHLDPVGMICMLLLGIGWAKPVPINPYRFRNRNRDIILVSVAGIVVNLILFILSMCLWMLTYKSDWSGMHYLRIFLQYMYTFNISLAVFNLLPVPPLDGFRLLNQIGFKGQLDINDRTMYYIRIGFLLVCISGVLGNAFSTVCNTCAQVVFDLLKPLIF